MGTQERFRKVNISEPTHKGANSGWGSAGSGKIKSENYGSLISETSRRASMISWNEEWNYNNANFITNSSQDQYVHQGADFGWGNAVRERPIISDHSFKAQNYTARRLNGQGKYTSMNSGSGKGNFHHDPGSFHRTFGSCEEWKKVVVGPSRDGSGNGSRELRTPEWNRPLVRPPNGGVQQGNGSFLPPRNNAWRQSTSQPHGGSDKGSERRPEDYKDFKAYNGQHASSKAGYNSSMQVKGRGQNVHRGQ